MDDLLPAGAHAVEMFTDPPGARLLPAEEAALGDAGAKRRAEFTTTRICARQALLRLGLAGVPVIPGPDRAPRWPAGVVGSITHCPGYRAAVVARAGRYASLGIDAEPVGPLPDLVVRRIALNSERVWLAELAATRPGVCWDRLLFSAKESVYKAWYPLARRWLGFRDARLTVDPQQATFHAELLVPGPTFGTGELTGFTGRWLVRDGFVLTAIAVPAPQGVGDGVDPDPGGAGVATPGCAPV